MELTPERKQQIEDEERQRLAEEKYRTQVRENLTSSAAPSAPQPARIAPKPERKSRMGWLLGILAVVAVILANRPSAPASGNTGSPSTTKIASGQIVVRANGYVQYRFQITPEMRDAHVVGRFNASGGSGNDVEAVIATEDEFTNWVNGHQARVFYSTQGRKTTDTFDVRLAPGTYYLGFNNRFSAFTAKYVFLEVDLNYQRMQTY